MAAGVEAPVQTSQSVPSAQSEANVLGCVSHVVLVCVCVVVVGGRVGGCLSGSNS